MNNKITDKRLVFKPFQYQWAYDYWFKQQNAHWLHCVSKNERVITNNGIYTVEELYNLRINLILFNGLDTVDSSPMLLTSKRELFKIDTKEGYTHTTTIDHRVMTTTGWKVVGDLVVGDVLMIQEREGLFGNIDEPELAYLAGYWQGDGTRDGDLLIWQVWESKYKFINIIEDCVRKVYIKHGLHSLRYNIPTFAKEQYTEHGVRSRRLCSMKFDKFKFTKNVIPEFVWKGNKSTVIEYLRGLFAADGTVFQSKKHESIKITQISEKFISDLQILLLNLGVKSKLYRTPERVGGLPKYKGIDMNYISKPTYRLEICEYCGVSLLDGYIGMFDMRGKIYRGVSNPKKSHPIKYARFTGMTSVGVDDVFCVNILNDYKAWVCNGFVTHNTEIQMNTDVIDWSQNLSGPEKNVIGNILKGFTQTEVIVNDYWSTYVTKWFPVPEVKMMAVTFAAFETIHATAYSYLNDTLGLDDFSAFLSNPETMGKLDILLNVDPENDSLQNIARSLAIFSAAAEGIQLYSAFAVLLSFRASNRLKGIGQQMIFSVRDESLHSEAGCKLFRVLCEENPGLKETIKKDIYSGIQLAINAEYEYIDWIFEQGDIPTMSRELLKNFIHDRANKKLIELGYKTKYNVDPVLLKDMEWFYHVTSGEMQTDFFSNRESGYSKPNDSWSDSDIFK